ncbi:sensor histidine kinase [Hasllibacter halocynthiae]|nr:histidine kinase dimerization/phosphoacceptor domain -containing protein [Hasllibacter halocynthiae]
MRDDTRDGPAAGPGPAEEVAALRAENDRLRRELSAARATMAWRAATPDDPEAEGDAPASDAQARLALLEAMLETVPVGVVLADARGRILHGNAWVERMLKHPVLHSADAESYGEWVSFHADGRQVESCEYPLSRVIRDGVDHSEIDVNYRRGDGSMFWMRVIGEPVRDADGNRVGATVALVDIDDERRLLDEKETLLGEVNHRVKNSLQLVDAIMSLQARAAHGEGAAVLKAASARLRAVAAVHAAFYHDDDVRTVEFGDHLRRFCATLADGFDAEARGIALSVEAEPVTIRAEKAVPLSLIVNELVTNAFAYAFPEDGGEGADAPDRHVRVSLARDGEGRVALEVSDDGTWAGTDGPGGPFGNGELRGGRPPGPGLPSSQGGLGATLVSTLARQLGATVTQERENGWSVRIAFEV